MSLIYLTRNVLQNRRRDQEMSNETGEKTQEVFEIKVGHERCAGSEDISGQENDGGTQSMEGYLQTYDHAVHK